VKGSDYSLVPLEGDDHGRRKVCPTCGYQRMPDDDEATPSWKCPSCARAYAKFAAQAEEGRAPPPRARGAADPDRRPSGSPRGTGPALPALGLGLLVLIGLLLAWAPRPEVTTWRGDPGLGVRLFVTERCGYCRRARDYLDHNQVPYLAYDVEKDAKARAAFRALGGRGVPLILIGEERIDGWNQSVVARLLEEQGLL